MGRKPDYRNRATNTRNENCKKLLATRIIPRYIHTHTHTYAYLHFNKAKLFSLWRRTSCTYDSDAGSMYYIQPVTVRRSITPRIATIITSNHLLPGIFDISRYTWQLSLWQNAPERGTASISNIYTKMYWHRYSNYR